VIPQDENKIPVAGSITATKVLLEIRDGIARLTLNRPDKRNALDGEVVAQLRYALAEADGDAHVRAMVISGAGKDFCSGADLAAVAQVAKAGVLDNISDARKMAEVFLAIRRTPKPVVAAVHGRALAGGCGLATACDIVLASESAQFGYPEVNVGFVPAMVMALLRRSVSEKAAFALVITGDVVTAARARELGLVHAVFPDDEFGEQVNAYLGKLAAKPSTAVALTKQLLYRADALSFESALEAGVEMNAIARMTDDFKRGVSRFLKKD
jgi:methylglutaconyl-CoA hydratase